jgi:hypothetical protein
LVVVETLVNDLIIVVETNPFPGERKRVLEVAQELFPGAMVILYPGVKLKGEKLWRQVFAIGDVDYRERLLFPVKEGEIDIIETERMLYEYVREDGTLPAIEVPKVLQLEVNSKLYRSVKCKLQDRGWVWKQRKEDGKTVKIVVAPR